MLQWYHVSFQVCAKVYNNLGFIGGYTVSNEFTRRCTTTNHSFPDQYSENSFHHTTMSSDHSNTQAQSQASLTEQWGNRDPNPDSTTTTPEDSTSNTTQTINEYSNEDEPEQKTTGATISQTQQPVINSNGVVIPHTRHELSPIETWTHDPIPTETLDNYLPTTISRPVQPKENENKPESTSPNSETGSTTPETETEDTTSTETRERTPIRPISTHAKRAAKNKEQTNTAENDAYSTHDGASDNPGTRVKVKPEQTTDNKSETDTQNKHERTTTKNSRSQSETPIGSEVVAQNCPECDGDIITEGTDQYCSECGLIISDQKIDPGPEWRSFNDSDGTSKSRVGGPVKNNIHDKGLSTVIGSSDTDAQGKPLSPRMRKKMSRLRKWDSRFKVKNTKERNLRQAFGEIQRISSEMDIPEYVEETACTVYRRALDEELLPGRSIEAMASASVYIAMRQASIPKTLDHLMDYCRVKEARVTGAYSYLGRELGIEIKPPEVLEYLNRVASELDVTKETERTAEDLLQTSVEQNLHSGKAPSGMAAAAIYAATMITRCDRVTQKNASDAGDVCELTIRTRHRELLDAYDVDHTDISPPSQSEIEQTVDNMTDPVEQTV